MRDRGSLRATPRRPGCSTSPRRARARCWSSASGSRARARTRRARGARWRRYLDGRAPASPAPPAAAGAAAARASSAPSSRRSRAERARAPRRRARARRYAVASVTDVAHAGREARVGVDRPRHVLGPRPPRRCSRPRCATPTLDVRAVRGEPPRRGGAARRRARRGRCGSSRRVRGSALWKRALGREAPPRRGALRAHGRAARSSASPDGPADTLLQGAIDLVFEEDDGWVLVDYKSDAVTPQNRDAARGLLRAADRAVPALLGAPDRAADAGGAILRPDRPETVMDAATASTPASHAP